MRIPLMLAGLVLLSITIAGCDEKLSDLTGPTPDLEPTFSSIQREIFESSDSSGRPACVTCHKGGLPFLPFSMNLTSASAYANLVGVASREKPSVLRVAAGDPENSYLVHKLENSHSIVGAQMPLNGPYLSQGQIDVIRRWIEIGAPNN
jgi:hypothetical protein